MCTENKLIKVCFVCTVFRALIRHIKFVKKRPTRTHEYINVILLHSNHRHVSAIPLSIFGVVRTRIHLQL
jgi:hypothetical protein